MAICEACKREMLTADGCGVPFVIVNGRQYKRIAFGAAGDLHPDQSGRCGDCGARRGFLHHVGCDCEACPVCGGQLIGCNCVVEYDDEGGAAL